MLTYRAFRNTDPPHLAALWRSQSHSTDSAAVVSSELLEQFVFAKLYFEYAGLTVAWEGREAVGFAHAGFGPNDEESQLSTELGTTCLILVRPDCDQVQVAAGLLDHSECYLRDRGTKVIYGGGIRPLNAFYFGLYGGSEMPGVLESDTLLQGLYSSHGYQEIDRTLILRRDLGNFEAPMERQQMQIRRQMIVEVTNDPPSRTWWEAATLGEFDLTRFAAIPRTGGRPIAQATFRNMELIPVAASHHAMGLIDLWVDESFRRRGVAVFLLSEALRQFARQGVATVEAQAMQHNVAALGMYRKLGFQHLGHGSVFRKEAT